METCPPQCRSHSPAGVLAISSLFLTLCLIWPRCPVAARGTFAPVTAGRPAPSTCPFDLPERHRRRAGRREESARRAGPSLPQGAHSAGRPLAAAFRVEPQARQQTRTTNTHAAAGLLAGRGPVGRVPARPRPPPAARSAAACAPSREAPTSPLLSTPLWAAARGSCARAGVEQCVPSSEVGPRCGSRQGAPTPGGDTQVPCLKLRVPRALPSGQPARPVLLRLRLALFPGRGREE